MSVDLSTLKLTTQGNADILDITSDVTLKVNKSGIENGLITVFCPSATSSVTTIEYESGCIKDLKRLFEEIVPEDRHYFHNARWGDGNGHAHVRAALLGPSLSIPIINNRLSLGTWQQIIFIDFDNRARQRELVLQIVGE